MVLMHGYIVYWSIKHIHHFMLLLFPGVRTLKKFSSSYFETINAILLTIISSLYNIASVFILLV